MPRKKKLPSKGEPEVIRVGNAVVKIYGSPVKGRPRYVVAYRGSDGKRRTQSFADYNDAKLEAENAVVEIHNGTLEKLELTGEERRAHERAIAITPEDMGKLLRGASDDLIPLLAIGAFAGLRTAEILRLDWEEVDFKQSHIEIKSGKSKTAQRRLAPLLPNLLAWLKPYRWYTGLVCPGNDVESERRELARSLEIPWPNNALRHSYGSYRMATTDDAQKVSIEMGNSPNMIFRNYRKVVTKAEAEKWFQIRPEK